MRIHRWRPSPRVRSRDTFRLARRGDLHMAMPPPYDMSDVAQRQALQAVEELIQRLQPGGLDGNSREVLHNLVNDWTEQDTARLDAHRPEWKAVGRILTGLAREEVARRQRRYDADYRRAQEALQALTVTRRQLTGKDPAELPSPELRRPEAGPVRSTLGRLVLPEDEDKDGQPRPAGTGDPTEGATA